MRLLFILPFLNVSTTGVIIYDNEAIMYFVAVSFKVLGKAKEPAFRSFQSSVAAD